MKHKAVERIAALRAQMAERGIDLYVIPTSDFHASEYVGEYFKAREYITGFTGSAGTAVITQTTADLWTDGRYFIQAGRQLEGSGITLRRMGEEGVPKIKDFIRETIKTGGCIGFDGRVISAKDGEEYETIAKEKQGTLYTDEDIVGTIWQNRPGMSKEPFFILEEQYSGRSTAWKLADVREKIKEAGAQMHILSSLYDIAWLLNVRGSDIFHVPVVLSYLIITQETCIWFVQEELLTEEQSAYLAEHKITVRPYDSIYDYAAGITAETVLLDEKTVNYRIFRNLPESVKKRKKENPSERLKAVKNPTEIANTITAHIKDGVAFTKFMY